MSIVVIQCVVGSAPVITGTANPVTGIADGSSSISCIDFENVRVSVKRGGTRVPSFNPGNGSAYYTKALAGGTISFSSALVDGEFIYIKTIR
jgi:hypothetical protein